LLVSWIRVKRKGKRVGGKANVRRKDPLEDQISENPDQQALKKGTIEKQQIPPDS